MQIRIKDTKTKGKKIQLLRSEYLREQKRSTQRLIATFDADDEKSKPAKDIPADVRLKLTDSEAVRVLAWMWERKRQKEAQDRADTVKDASQAIKNIADALDAGAAISAEQIDQVRADIKGLQLAIRKATKRAARAKKSDSI